MLYGHLTAFRNEAHKNLALLGGVVDHLLRMPLHGHQEGIFLGGFHRFHKSVLGARRYFQPVAPPA